MSYFLINKNNISGLISHLIAIQYYNIPLENYLNNVTIDTAKYFHSGDCDINNKIEIKELSMILKEKAGKQINIIYEQITVKFLLFK